jgi:hypothetical protein
LEVPHSSTGFSLPSPIRSAGIAVTAPSFESNLKKKQITTVEVKESTRAHIRSEATKNDKSGMPLPNYSNNLKQN